MRQPVLKVEITGPVLLLMGPIGIFFSRLARHLERRGVPVYKVSFPLHEFGFRPSQRIPYSAEMDTFGDFLQHVIEEKGIRHLFMYGDFIDPHRIAIDVVEKMNQAAVQKSSPAPPVESWVFELGYIRPNYVSLEQDRVNARSSLNKPVEFYRSLQPVVRIPQARRESGLRWRKAWKIPTFLQHAFTSYPIISGPHKLQPRPSYLFAQVRGFLRKYWYVFSERSVHLRLRDGKPYTLVALQVETDSQITLGSHYSGMEPFIRELIGSFAMVGPTNEVLVFKHHPRDRGYTNYRSLIEELACQFGISDRVLYFHDGALGPLLKRAKALITINSTVGLQALFHATPTKVMGRAFYNLTGLTDQQDLEGFWHNPQPSDRDLFRRFYQHLICTTQINGNFDGLFPFRHTFAVSSELEINSWGPLPSFLQKLFRILSLIEAYGLYGLQLIALCFGLRERARSLLEKSAQAGLRAFGVQVFMDRRAEEIKRPQIHIANHGHPLDVLLVQGYFCECGITTASDHMGWLLPFFRVSASNYGHLHLNYLQPDSRLDGLRGLLTILKKRGRVFLHPSGSLVTPITERVSGSLYLLSRRSGAVLVPWHCSYHGFPAHEKHLRYKPLALLWQRLFGPEATIVCQEGRPIDPNRFRTPEALSKRISRLYLIEERKLDQKL
ncbi:capsular biosynthesis protein [Cyanobium sp. Morenito 9A2]|uniref:capsular biosynthesis protein n=1 Tax=Cyanobium sp. Morenito 9A2 TaxID=2823718 RepID=UPI0020CD06C6|nr:capsular biosynthesis protein [Cyanobium sp. Morenito 9A2]MCP9851224.1 capsular biosynthesis protein [Cyanobium sp. Morenito 9A2]